jgi:hypothetical protein
MYEVQDRQTLIFYFNSQGYIAVVFGVMRVYTTWQIAFNTYDFTWLSSQAFLWSLLEMHIGAACANAPALRAFLRRVPRPEDSSTFRTTSSRRHSASTRRQSSITTRTRRQSSITSRTPCTSDKPRVQSWKQYFTWVPQSSRSSIGYLREPHTPTSIDMPSGTLPANAHFAPGRRDSGVPSTVPEYKDYIIHSRDEHVDVAMSSIMPSVMPSVRGRQSQAEEDLQALPTYVPPSKKNWLPSARSMSPFGKGELLC